ncbi:MAG: alpha/beta fold hydrolase [Alphaproteobacteria bacterium]
MKKIYILFIALFLTGCVSKAPELNGFKQQSYMGKELYLTGQEKNIKAGQKLRIYIDGNAETVGLFSKKAALRNSIAAGLAQKDKSKSILYLNRPCYFSEDKKCLPVVWEEGKYMPEVIDEMVYVLSNLAEKYKIPEMEFVGYDGGGAVALLVATRLNGKKINVSKVITIAGILDTEQYARMMDEPLLEGSLNPAREGFSISKIPQLHIVGALDKKTPVFFAQELKKRMMNPVSYKVQSYASADHDNWLKFKMDY